MTQITTIQTQTKANTQRFDFYQEVTNKMITLLEQGVTPWRCPWKGYGLARNIATGHIYRGINALLMNLTEHPIPYFMSFKQAQTQGGHIRKGAKSERVFFYKTMYKDENGKSISAQNYERLIDQGKEAERITFLKSFRVFNITDIEGIEIEIPEITLTEHQRITRCDQIITAFKDAPKFVFEDANRAYYAPLTDQLNMPQLGQFDDVEAYYETLFHELTHSTGHASRLNREGIVGSHAFGSKEYAKEELIAEMGASFLCAHTGIDVPPVTENSAAYLTGWLKRLKEDKKLIFRAAAAAQRAVDYILDQNRKP